MVHFVWKNRGLLFVPLFLALFVSGCTCKVPKLAEVYDNSDCQQLWQNLEQAIHAHDVHDPSTIRILNFPYLRSDRYLQALAARAESTEEQHFVLGQMRRLDLEKRSAELDRLPKSVRASLLGGHTTGTDQLFKQRLDSCSQEFLAADKHDGEFINQVRETIDLDRDYSIGLRSVGLYPLSSLVVDYVAENAQDEMVSALSEPVPAEALTKMHSFKGPEPRDEMRSKLADILRKGRSTSLLSLQLSAKDKLSLAQYFAPILTTGKEDGHDQFGQIVNDQGRFRVDGNKPVVYYYFSQTFVQNIPALQINYVIWFSERTQPAPWFEKGDFDGLTFRVTLDWDGQPIFVDTMLNCGCYHFALFDDTRVRGTLTDSRGFIPTVAGTMPELQGNERFHFTIKPGWHQIDKVHTSSPAPSYQNYALRPYEDLERLDQGGQAISLFDVYGRLEASHRPERFFLFVMGIPKVGTMRQRGRHPITLTGRSYFDDPYLFDNAFAYQSPLPSKADLVSDELGKEMMSRQENKRAGNDDEL